MAHGARSLNGRVIALLVAVMAAVISTAAAASLLWLLVSDPLALAGLAARDDAAGLMRDLIGTLLSRAFGVS